MRGRVRVRLVVGRYEGDASPVIAGCVDLGLYEVIDYEDGERMIQAIKKQFAGPARGDYEWREINASFALDDLAELFEPIPIHGEIEKDSS